MLKNETTGLRDDIDFVSLIKPLWMSRWLLLKFVILVSFLGLFIAIASPKEFTASTLFLSQSGDGTNVGSSLGGLGALAGITGIGSSSNEVIPPELYPQIVSGSTFKFKLISKKLYIPSLLDSVDYKSYYNDFAKPSVLGVIRDYTIGLPTKILSLLVKPSKIEISQLSDKKDLLIQYDQATLSHFNRIGGQMSLDYNQKNGVISLSMTMPDPFLAAQLTKYAEQLLKEEISNYKVQYAKERVSFARKRFESKRTDFLLAQENLALFRDRNIAISTASARNTLERLQADFDLKFKLYTEAATQLEQSEYLLDKSFPTFTVIQPVNVPTNKSAPNRPLILLAFVFSGLFLGVSWIYFHGFIVNFKTKLE